MKFAISVVVTSLVVAYASARAPIRYREGPTITKPVEGHHSSLGVVHGVRPCGGPGKVVQYRVDGCHNEGTCRIEAENGKKVPGEYEFVPSQDIESLGIRFVVIEDATIISVYEKEISGSGVTAGETYIVNTVGTISERLKGRKLTTQYSLYRVADNEVETCVEADFEFY